MKNWSRTKKNKRQRENHIVKCIETLLCTDTLHREATICLATNCDDRNPTIQLEIFLCHTDEMEIE